MTVWELDFYRRPLQNAAGDPLWELLICDSVGAFQFVTYCAQAQASASWLLTQLQSQLQAWIEAGHTLPDRLLVFRPQTLHLLETAGQQLGIAIEATRRTPRLKHLLVERSRQYATLTDSLEARYTGQGYQPLALDKLPPVPLPEKLWGDRWRFASLPAVDLIDTVSDRMIPILSVPEALLPLKLGLASTVPIPGVVIDGGRQAMRLANWLQQSQPVSLGYIPGAPDGLILEAGLADRWILTTFEDTEVATAGQAYEQHKQLSQGLHFLLVQPDDSGMTYSGFWLLKPED
ncbi:Tab2/Atab2 family RNA-binding protein [Phormidium sp. FACHB-592]|uniref:Tab2/Atab2 family RNA-binding protein n=1 Tax=Stenomitos frigidus AS-A4 TaxID=2933935 RepID=A0ABV0KTB2_9CYAN|nr:Tab2/Atab2 family RNA-binding protein [Phormidium sp. FACHB-592]MBD2074237.1 Tab2/Atab2 family RNA-binding protein [Phormidium sp. FACHB-592]